MYISLLFSPLQILGVNHPPSFVPSFLCTFLGHSSSLVSISITRPRSLALVYANHSLPKSNFLPPPQIRGRRQRRAPRKVFGNLAAPRLAPTVPFIRATSAEKAGRGGGYEANYFQHPHQHYRQYQSIETARAGMLFSESSSSTQVGISSLG